MVPSDEVAAELAQEFPEVKMNKMLVDAMTCRMVLHPETLDTIVATSLHADILSDLAATLMGSIEIAPTSNLDPTRKNPSMFEPIHVGKGVANPAATFWTAAEMLARLRERKAGDRWMKCVEKVTESGNRTRDPGGTAGTE